MFFIKEFTIEEIRPTRTYSPESRTYLTDFSVITHTSTLTDNNINNNNINNNLLQRFNLFPQLRLPSIPQPPRTTFTTTTVTEISTVTSDLTTQLTVTLFGRPITTEYTRQTTVVRK